MIEIMIMYILLLVEIALVSTCLYVFVHRKTHISLRYLYKDNVVNQTDMKTKQRDF